MALRFIKAFMAMAFIASLSTAQAQSSRKLVIANEGGFPPYNMTTADGTVQGFDVDIGNAICQLIHAQCTFVTNEWSGIIPALLSKKFDVILGAMGITEERKKRVIFSDPYGITYSEFGVVAGKEFAITPQTMATKVIGVQQGTTNAAYLEKTYPGAQIRRYPSIDALISDLKAGRIDIVLGLEEKFTKEGDAPKLVTIGEGVQVSEGIGIAFRPEDTALRDEFNAALKTLRADGTWATLQKKWAPTIK
ncbi:transporter substrate-binding domain-containing protein [Labrys sp. KNU-23]|uniref:transporter substrate-binding domain-containing protein n=1 Tax=Labrys sp. KNU-23 TaxID=2789216 RepID=UPI0011ECEC43|nr:transporter substrate-binding domain-containing protein [Labrys sp. KNU-23]QEN84942.1 transporter substrate-binding domain-containing protein [Labrys sp. KNU-23]